MHYRKCITESTLQKVHCRKYIVLNGKRKAANLTLALGSTLNIRDYDDKQTRKFSKRV